VLNLKKINDLNLVPVSRGIRSPLKVIRGDQLIYPPGPQYTIRNDPP